jgi:hypothetical protein
VVVAGSPDDAHDDNDIAEEVDADRVDQAQRRPPLLNKVGDTHTLVFAAGVAYREVPMPRSEGSTVPRVVVDLDEVGEGGPITVLGVDSHSRRLQTETQTETQT